MIKKFIRSYLILNLLLLASAAAAQTPSGVIRGTVLDAKSKQPVIGASVSVDGTAMGTATDLEGKFLLTGVPAGPSSVRISFLSYKPFTSGPLTIKGGESTELNVELVEEVSELENVVVVATRKVNSDAGLLSQMREMSLVASGTSAQAIAKTQDRDAAEVVRRIPGISILDDKFVVVRGLAQRYNNVWINGGAVPSSEADTRSFSFDILPSSQLDNMMIVKSPAPEIPGDFSGGFVLIRTKVLPEKNSIQLSYTTGFNNVTNFHDFKYNPGSAADAFGFGSASRELRSGVPDRVDDSNTEQVDRVTKNGFREDWRVKSRRPLWDQKFNFAINRKFDRENGDRFGLVGALNYSNTNKSFLNMENSRYGIYNGDEDTKNYSYKYTDNQYTNDVKLGAMLNLSYLPAPKDENHINKYEFRNLFNQLGRNRYTEREGFQNISGYYDQQKEEFLYASRGSYTGQFAGDHRIRHTRLDWNAGYSYANKRQPDRRIVERQKDPGNGIDQYQIDQSFISRDFIRLDEHIASAAVNLSQPLNPSAERPIELKAGLYGEYKTRTYDTRAFEYKWDIGADLPQGFASLPIWEIMLPSNLGADKIHINDQSERSDNYKANNHLEAAYAAFNIPLGKFNIYAGARLELFRTAVTTYGNVSDKKRTYDYTNLLPSLNATYNFNRKSLLRLAYGMTVNRPEFRELSPSTYEDFDMYSLVMGNPNLKQAVVQNLDLRYEWYPASGEIISLGAFYKRFKNPIEWTYTDAGGSYIYSFQNALSADLYGLELEVKKDLAFMGLRNFSLAFNASWIKSNVHFPSDGIEHDRPMQGQSPYLVNTGLFYQNDKIGFSAAVLYNRIGKRIVGIGRTADSQGNTQNNTIPDIYEMPRNAVDITLSQRLSKVFELKLSGRDLLAENIDFKQFPPFTTANSTYEHREQVTKSYNPGRSFFLTVVAAF